MRLLLVAGDGQWSTVPIQFYVVYATEGRRGEELMLFSALLVCLMTREGGRDERGGEARRGRKTQSNHVQHEDGHC